MVPNKESFVREYYVIRDNNLQWVVSSGGGLCHLEEVQYGDLFSF